MIYKFDLINPYSPRSKCGAEAIIGSTLGLGGSIFNSLSTSSTNSTNRRWTTYENEKNRQFNSREAQKQRDWAHDEWLSQFNKQSQEWYNQQSTLQEQQWQNFLKQADYNSPKNQVSRLAEGGFNPSALFSQGSSGLVSAATGNIANVPSPSVPTGGTVSGNAASASPVSPLNAPAPQVDLGSLGSFLANAGKAYNENKKLRPEIDSMLANIQNVIADTANKELLNIAQSFENDFLEQTKNPRIQKMWNDVKLQNAEIIVKMAMGQYIDVQTQHEYVAKFLDEVKAKLTVEQYMQACIYTANMQKILDSEINLNNKKAFESGANGYFIQWRAESQKLDYVIGYLTADDEVRKRSYDAKKVETEWELAAKSLPVILDKMVSDGIVSRYEANMAKERLKSLNFDNLKKSFESKTAERDYEIGGSPIPVALRLLGLDALKGIFHVGL